MHARDEPERINHLDGPARRAAEPVADSGAVSALHPGGLAPDALPALQRTIGNAAVVGMLAAQRRHDPAATDQGRWSSVHQVLRSPGRPLDESTKTEMEARLDADFSDVRLHTDTAAQRSAAELGAHAYTSHNHVVIGRGGGDPHTLAHELTHVIQQRQGSVAGTDRGDGVRVSDPSDRFERAAEANAARVMADPVPVARSVDDASHAAGHTHDHDAVAVQRFGGPQGMDPTEQHEQWTNPARPPTAFLGYVAVTNTESGMPDANEQYAYDAVRVTDVQVGRERGFTRFGEEGQKSHTTAWVLTRRALENLGGITAERFVAYFEAALNEFDGLAVTVERPPVVGHFTRLLGETRALVADIKNHPRPLHLWQPALSALLVSFVQTYQLSPMTAYASGEATGDNEGGAMGTLEVQEALLRDDDAGFDLGTALDAVAKLQDYKPNPSLPEPNLSAANRNFWTTLHTAFPLVAAQLGDLPAQRGSSFHPSPVGLPAPNLGTRNATYPWRLRAGRLEAGFGVDVFVNLGAVDAQQPMMPLGPGDVVLARVLMSTAGRPKAQEDPQKSHFAAWGLVKAATERQQGKRLDEVVRWVQDGLAMLTSSEPVTENLRSDWRNLFQQVEAIARQTGSMEMPVHDWTPVAGSLLQGYLVVYNASCSATGGRPAGDSRSGGGGEGTYLQRLRGLEARYQAASQPVVPDADRTTAVDAAVALLDVSALRSKILSRHLAGRDGDPGFADVVNAPAGSDYWATMVEVQTVMRVWAHFIQGAYPFLVRHGVLDETAMLDKVRAGLVAAPNDEEAMVMSPRTTRSGLLRG
ncbi:DUF4157 domain-containing protein [Saccharothrix isguenensis]